MITKWAFVTLDVVSTPSHELRGHTSCQDQRT